MKVPDGQDQNLASTAIHEAGHAVACVRQGRQFTGASIVSKENSLGRANLLDSWMTSVERDPNGYLVPDPVEVEKNIVGALAGYAAQIHDDPWGEEQARGAASSDFEEVEELIALLQSPAAFEEYVDRARAFVTANWSAIRMVADELLEHKRLDAHEIYLLVDIADGQWMRVELERYRMGRD